MFDIGFWEMALVALVSLIVIGPERLPKAARIAGYWIGKSRSMVASMKAEIKAELQAEEMRQILKEQTDLTELHQAMEEGEELLHQARSALPGTDKESTQRDRHDTH